MTDRTCANCGTAVQPRKIRRGMCGACYQRAKKYGSPGPTPLRGIELFWSKVNRDEGDGCWTWSGTICRDGYGSFGGPKALYGTRLAHRIAYIDVRGPIPDGLVLDHLCRNRACVNPGHLEPVTQRVNILRGEGLAAQNASKETCIRGHEFDRARQGNRRDCSKCRAEYDRRKYLRRLERTCA